MHVLSKDTVSMPYMNRGFPILSAGSDFQRKTLISGTCGGAKDHVRDAEAGLPRGPAGHGRQRCRHRPSPLRPNGKKAIHVITRHDISGWATNAAEAAGAAAIDCGMSGSRTGLVILEERQIRAGMTQRAGAWYEPASNLMRTRAGSPIQSGPRRRAGAGEWG
jgi:hypothetical protein